jgi:hypothetical protein
MPPASEIAAALRERLQATHVVRRATAERKRTAAAARGAAARRGGSANAAGVFVQFLAADSVVAFARLTRARQAVVDVSDGCGSKFEVEVESPQFEGKALLARHRLVRLARTAKRPQLPQRC